MQLTQKALRFICLAAAGALLAAPLVATAAGAGAAVPDSIAAAPAAGTQLKAGAAKMVISGLMGTDDASYPKLNEFPLEDLYLRAIVVENNGERVAFIAADLSGIDEKVWAEANPRVAAALGIPETHVVMTSTHVHSDRPQGFDANPGGGRYGAAKIGDWAVELVTKALANLEPAEVGYGTGELNLSVNRDTIDRATKKWTQAGDFDYGVTDPELNVLTFYRTADRSPIAAYFAYPMHPVTGYLTQNTSGDFPAAASRYIEKAFGDKNVVAVYNQGAGGDLNPRWLRAGTNVLASRSGVDITGYELVRENVEAPIRNNAVETKRPDAEVLRDLFRYESAVGAIIGEETIRVMTYPEERMTNPTIWSERDTVTCPGRIRLDNAREGVPGEYTYDGAPDVKLRTGALAIGNVLIAQVNAEIYVKIGLRIKNQSPLGKTMVVTVANGKADSGYVLDYQSEYHQTFQALGSKLKPGCAEEALADSITKMTTKYVTQSATPMTPKTVDVAATAKTQCVAGSPYLAVSVVNNEKVAVDVKIATPYGTKLFGDVAPGKSAANTFAVRGADAVPNAVTVTARPSDHTDNRVTAVKPAHEKPTCQ